MEAECAALRNMVEERNTFITTMKTEIYRKEYKNDTERVDLHNQILQKDAIIKKLDVSVWMLSPRGYLLVTPVKMRLVRISLAPDTRRLVIWENY